MKIVWISLKTFMKYPKSVQDKILWKYQEDYVFIDEDKLKECTPDKSKTRR